MKAYYNDFDPFVCQWVRNLIEAGLITPGDVDERPIEDVQATDLGGYDRCHFFCGIAIWDHALNQAGWGNSPVWTGSCPCQPFSCAGKQLGTADKRHLWPAWFRLIRECRPEQLFGEQVAGPAALEWFDLVSADLEDAGYAVGAADLCAAGCGAPHIRQRLYWMAHDERDRRQGGEHADTGQGAGTERRRFADSGDPQFGWVANAGRAPGCSEQLNEPGKGLRREPGPDHGAGSGECGGAGRLAHPAPGGQRIDGGAPGDAGHVAQRESDGGLGDADSRPEAPLGGIPKGPSPHATGGFWSTADWLPCRDGKARPVESRSEPMAPELAALLGYVRDGDRTILQPLIKGTKNRIGRLRAYGNCLTLAVAVEFVKSAMECIP